MEDTRNYNTIIRNASILIIDDDKDIASLAKRILGSAGFTAVRVATTVSDSLECIAGEPVDLILMDIDLKSTRDGIDLAMDIRKTSDIPIMFITGHFDDRLLQKARHIHPAGYIMKPYEPRMLTVNVELALVNSLLKKENTQLKNTIIQIIEAMEKTIAMKDPYTSNHQLRVAKLSMALAVEMGLPGKIIEGIYYTSLIHEYGKLFVPSEILSKPGHLTEKQFQFIKDHPIKGYEALRTIEFPWPVADIILQHHERIDGSGYPYGLSGDSIMVEARIIAVADVMSSMTSYKPYRTALPVAEALDEIDRNSGEKYDPEVVTTCKKIFSEKNFTF